MRQRAARAQTAHELRRVAKISVQNCAGKSPDLGITLGSEGLHQVRVHNPEVLFGTGQCAVEQKKPCDLGIWNRSDPSHKGVAFQGRRCRAAEQRGRGRLARLLQRVWPRC